ncbi:unnamed protein product [Darwinula stevensoni]|uniref:MSP domain-containing protein n=1 Tax=Darwinula stevensoni TaxID=69355 RepID=A0A7R8X5C5_9CRUS|nr:unnamed protein product [Darwinula stevensoni]CAG0885812.1 unnamed protein product [Darwinula stevensoni]
MGEMNDSSSSSENPKKAELIMAPDKELVFEGPFNETVISQILLTNPMPKPLAFKVRTTAPKNYCVKPNGGILQPHERRELKVMLSPFQYDPEKEYKDKFMIQRMIAPVGEKNHVKLFSEAPPSAICDSKLRCVFKTPARDDARSFMERDQLTGKDGDQLPIMRSPESLENKTNKKLGMDSGISRERGIEEKVFTIQVSCFGLPKIIMKFLIISVIFMGAMFMGILLGAALFFD